MIKLAFSFIVKSASEHAGHFFSTKNLLNQQFNFPCGTYGCHNTIFRRNILEREEKRWGEKNLKSEMNWTATTLVSHFFPRGMAAPRKLVCISRGRRPSARKSGGWPRWRLAGAAAALSLTRMGLIEMKVAYEADGAWAATGDGRQGRRVNPCSGWRHFSQPRI